MITRISKDDCVGCALCATMCGQHAIKMIPDKSTGFLYPFIDESKCNKCGVCINKCPVLNRIECCDSEISSNISPICFAVRSKDDETRFLSTSGGFFTEIATEILANGGKVYGVGYSTNMDVLHMRIEKMDQLRILQKSKYVQSDMKSVYTEIKKDVESGCDVLFVGCPCQVSAIYSFLGRKYDNLYTIEFICMGVNSPLAYHKWIGELEDISNSRVTNITFKYKLFGWRQSPLLTKIDFSNDTHIILDAQSNYYMKGYLQGGLFIRKCCTKCVFNGTNRKADFVVGDHWGAGKDVDDDKGTSVVIVSTPHGKRLFKSVSHKIEIVEIDFNDVIQSNPRIITSVPYNPAQVKFYSLLKTCSFSEAVNSVIGQDEPHCDYLKTIVFHKQE